MVRVYIASSLDGFIAGPGDDLSWLPPPSHEVNAAFEEFMAGIGAILMGRSTYRVVEGFGGEWPYGDTPVFVATTHPLEPASPTVRAVSGSPRELLAQVRAVSDGDVYLDGGNLIRQFLDADLIDTLTVTVVPVILGSGAPLFAGVRRRQRLELVECAPSEDGMVRLDYLRAPGDANT